MTNQPVNHLLSAVSSAFGVEAATVRACAHDSGADFPPVVTRGESQKDMAMNIDWLSFTWENESLVFTVDSLCGFFQRTFGRKVYYLDRGKGLLGFKYSAELYCIDDHGENCLVAVYATGGDAQKGRSYISMNGTGCHEVKDWIRLQSFLDSIDARITRVDLALDDFEGRNITIDKAVQWYKAGLFTNNGHPPSYSVAGDWLDCSTQNTGRTLYIGKRVNGKLCRIYEKGKQLGDKSSPWTRFEIELKSKDRIIPTEVLANPVAYFRGQYPIACELASGLSDQVEKIKTVKQSAKISLSNLVQYAQTAYGKLVNVLRHGVALTDSEIVDSLLSGGTPRRLQNVSLSREAFLSLSMEYSK